MEQLTNFPPIKWSLRHPRVAAWAVLSFGMVVLLLIEARDVGLQTGNWIALIIATVLVAGACIWIVSWEDGDETEPSPNLKTKTDEIQKVTTTDTRSADDVHRMAMMHTTADADDDRKRMDAQVSDNPTFTPSSDSSDSPSSADAGGSSDSGGGDSGGGDSGGGE